MVGGGGGEGNGRILGRQGEIPASLPQPWPWPLYRLAHLAWIQLLRPPEEVAKCAQTSSCLALLSPPYLQPPSGGGRSKDPPPDATDVQNLLPYVASANACHAGSRIE